MQKDSTFLVKRGLKLGEKTNKISKVELEVLQLIEEGIIIPRQMAIRRKVTPQAIYKTLTNLRKKGIINRLNKKVEKIRCTRLKTNKLRLHGQEFNIKLIYRNSHYVNLLKHSNVYEFDGNTIRLYNDSIEVYSGHSFYGNTVKQVAGKSQHYWNNFFRKLENDLKVILIKPRVKNMKQVKGHIAEMDNEVAQENDMKGIRWGLRTDDDGKIWLLTDFSNKRHELEAVHPSTHLSDMEKIQGYLNDIRNNAHNLPSQNKALTETLLFTLTELASAQLNSQNQFNALIKLFNPDQVKKDDKNQQKIPDYFG